MDTVMNFAYGFFGNLSELHCNTRKLTYTGFKPNRMEVRVLDDLFVRLKFAIINFPGFYEARKFYLQGLRMERFEKQFEEYTFWDYLVYVHHWNFVKNRIQPTPCTSVTSIDFMSDVLETMSPTDSRQFGDVVLNPQTGEQEERTVKYSLVYPNLQWVTVINRQVEGEAKEVLNESDVYRFLLDCRGLTTLDIRYTEFGPAFYSLLGILRSLETLTVFYLIEEEGWLAKAPNKHFNFDFLSSFR